MNKKKGFRSVRFALVLMVFGIMLFTHFIIGATFVIFIEYDLYTHRDGSPLSYMAILFIISNILGTIITGFIGKKLLGPMYELTNKMQEVAKGNFNVQMETNIRNEFGYLINSFNKMVRELRGLEIMRNDFVTSISHEFKTPIASIQGYATLLQDEELTSAERMEYTDMIITASRQLSSLSGNILKLSKLDNQEMVTNKKKYDLDEQIRQAILLLEPSWSTKNIDMDIELETVSYTGSEELLQQVWLNLLDNAIKYTDDSGNISVRLTAEDGYVTAMISDDGVGMDTEVQKRIFDKFYQGDKSRSSDGNGLGLALVKRIVELCGGTVAVESSLNEGSTFIVKLPIM